MTNPRPTTTRADVARLRAELVEARQRRVDGEHRWAVARYTSSTPDRPEDLDVELARLDATIAALEEALAAGGPTTGDQTAVDTPLRESPAKAPGVAQVRLSGAGGYLPSSAPSLARPESTPNVEPEYLTTREAAALLGCTKRHLENMRVRGDGPPYVRVGRVIRYPRTALLQTRR